MMSGDDRLCRTRKQGEGHQVRPRGQDLTLKWGSRGAWVAQSVERPTSAQVMASRFVGSSPASGSVLAAQSLEPASDSVSPSVSLSLKNKYLKREK